MEPLGWPWERRGVLGGPHGGPGRASERFWRSLRALGSILLESNGPKSFRFICFLITHVFFINFQNNYVQSDCIRKCKESLTLVLICRDEIVEVSL